MANAVNAGFKITDDMLVAAVKIDDVDLAVKSVMDQAGINEGTIAGLVFGGDPDYREEWATADHHYRLMILREWADAERVYDFDYRELGA